MKFDTVKIIYNENEAEGCISAYELSEFFNVIGSYVYCCNLDYTSCSNASFDVIIVIKIGINDNQLCQLQKNYPEAIFLDKPCLDRLEMPELKDIADIYAELNLLRSKIIIDDFKEEAEMVQQAQDNIVTAYMRIKDIKPESKYTIYTRVYLALYANKSCKLLSQRFLFDTKKCCNYLNKALDIDPEFKNVDILKAYLSEIDSQYKYSVSSYYKSGLEHISSMPYASYPLYKLGRYYENGLYDKQNAQKYYKLAYDANRYDCRAIYTQIQQELETRKNRSKPMYVCNEMISILSKKEKHNCLSPKEYKYLFIAYKVLEQGSSEIQQKKAQLINTHQNSLYTQIFGKDADKFLKLTQTKLKLIDAT